MFSVIIPVYNHAHYIRSAIASAMRSRLVSEILVVDDGSRDDSAEIIDGIARQHPRLIRNLTTSTRENLGAHVRLNQLCELATKEWIAVLNSDDEFIPGRFEIAQALSRRPSIELIGGSMLLVDDKDKILGEKRGLLDPEYTFPGEIDIHGMNKREHVLAGLCSQNFFATTSNIIFRKSLFTALGGFGDLRYAHDWEFVLKAALLGKVHLTRAYLTKYRLHSSNTIKEVSGHVDGEIARFFSRILADNPQIEQEPLYRAALQSNRHLTRFVPREAVEARRPQRTDAASFSWSRNQSYYTAKSQRRTEPSKISESDFSLRSSEPLPFRALENSALAVQQGGYDFALISMTLSEPPIVGLGSDGQINGVFNSRAATLFVGDGRAGGELRGRVIRCAPGDERDRVLTPLTSIAGFETALVTGSDIVFGDATAPSERRAIALPPTSTATGPLILVMPIFLAVGGVERNTIEVIRALRDRYRFLVVTTDWQAKHQGSLHYQLDALQVPVLDLAEIADRSEHVELMATVKEHYNPDAVWICNGSPWLADNAEEIRRIFSHTPIVDQQVYDTVHGWINCYNEPGIQSFDHFIAINMRIRKKFLEGIRIPSHRVSLIYSVVDTSKLDRPLANMSEARVLKEKIGLDLEQNCFAFIGRLTPQKQPIRFLALALRSQQAGLSDHFLLVGDGELGSECDRYIADHELKNVSRICFYDDSWAMMNKIDGLIVTSDFEGLPIVLLEALALGRPAFATDVGDIQLVLDDYGSGTVVDADAPEAEMWRAFQSWRNDLGTYTENARRHRTDVLERFSSRTISQQYAKIWEDLIAQNTLAKRIKLQ